MRNLYSRLILGLAIVLAAIGASVVASPASPAAAPVAQAGWLCDYGHICGKVTNASNSTANSNLLILSGGRQYLLSRGQSSTQRGVVNTWAYFIRYSCKAQIYGDPFTTKWITTTGGGWYWISERQVVTVRLISGCPSRGY